MNRRLKDEGHAQHQRLAVADENIKAAIALPYTAM